VDAEVLTSYEAAPVTEALTEGGWTLRVGQGFSCLYWKGFDECIPRKPTPRRRRKRESDRNR
jgi:hypothetical protein